MEENNYSSDLSDLYKNDSSNKVLFLDTKGTCFLCLKEIPNVGESENKTSSQNGMTEVCLRNICRYLNINSSSILLKSVQGDDELNDEEKEEAISQADKCDFSVALCSSCSTLSANLSKLICQWEMAKMLLKHDVTQFYERLIASEHVDDGSSWRLLQDKLTSNCSNSVEARLVENLRQETKKQCATKVKCLKLNSIPKVRLKNLRKGSEKRKISLNTLKKKTSLSRSTSTDSSISNVSISSHSSTTSSNLLTLKTRSYFKNKSAKFSSLDNENSDEPTSTSQFSKSSGSLPNKKWQCNSKSGFGCGKGFTRKAHLVAHQKYHCSCRKQRGIPLQTWQQHNIFENQVLTDVLNQHCEKSKGSTSNTYRCLLCKNLPKAYPSATVKHIINVHIEVIFAHKRPSSSSSLSEQDFSQICKDTLADKKLITSRSCNTTKEVVFCTFCGIRNRNRSDYVRYHLVVKHLNILERKLLERLEKAGVATSNSSSDSQPSASVHEEDEIRKESVGIHATDQLEITIDSGQKVDESYYENKSTVLSDCKTLTKMLPSGDRQCSVCQRVFKDQESLNRLMRVHIVSCHPGMFFSGKNDNPHHLSEEVLNLLCKSVLFNETEKASQLAQQSKSAKDRLFHCSYCNQQLRQTGRFRLHLVVEHYQIVKKIILASMESADPAKLCTPDAEKSFKSASRSRSSEPSDSLKNNNAHNKTFKRKRKLNVNQKHLNSSRKKNGNIPLQKRPNLKNHTISENIVLTDVLNKHCEKSDDNDSTRSTYCCLLCKNSKKAYPATTAIKHLVNIHTEVFFAHKRPCSILERDFIQICKRNLADKEFVSSRKCNSNSKQIVVLCKICGWKSGNRYWNLRYHLIANHFDILERKLSERLEKAGETIVYSDSISIDLLPSNPGRGAGVANKQTADFYSNFQKNSYMLLDNYYHCLHCNYFSPKKNIHQISKHLLNNHSEKLMISAKVPQLSEMEFRDCCKMVLSNESKKGKEEATRRGIKKISLQAKNPQQWVCNFCNKTHSSAENYRHHLVFKHFEDVKRILVEAQTKIVEENEQSIPQDFMMMAQLGDIGGHAEEVSHLEEYVEVVLENMEEDVKVSQKDITNNLNVNGILSDEFLVPLPTIGEVKIETILPD